MTKKFYGFNFTKAEVDRLDYLLLETKMNRTDFFEGAMRQYNKMFYDRMDTSKAQTCDKCGAIYKGVINCPKCLDIEKSPL